MGEKERFFVASQQIMPFLMFTGKAEEAMTFYTSVFDGSEILSVERYGPGGAGAEGTVLHATFSLKGQVFACIDSPPVHSFTFTPSISFWVTMDTPDEIDRVFGQLAQDGVVLMELGAYPFSRRYGWVQDKFGVSWQLSL